MKKLLATLLLLTACGTVPTATPIPIASTTPPQTLTEAWTPSQTFTPPSTATFIPEATATSQPYERYTIEYLRKRTYGGGGMDLVQTLREQDAFNSYLVRYQSDDLFIYAMMNIPNDDGPFPVVVIAHGYARPESYSLLATGYALDTELARKGFITIQPTLRNYYPSDHGDNLFRVGDAIDVLNLIAVVKENGGLPGTLEKADPTRIGVAGHSMGGGISIRVLTISGDVRGGFLYAPISGDEKRNIPLFMKLAQTDLQFNGEQLAPKSDLSLISASSYYSYITAPVLLAHGDKDRIVPYQWSKETCRLMEEAGVDVQCDFYAGVDHVFDSEDEDRMLANMVKFFRQVMQ